MKKRTSPEDEIRWLSGRGCSGLWHLEGKLGETGGHLGGRDIGANWTPRAQSRRSGPGKPTRRHDCRSEKSKLHAVSSIKRSLSTRGILSRSTGGGTNGFSSSLVGLVLDAISATVPATNNVSGVF
jgi:hypothetical protein